ncbi:DNA-3-methyladenine glycosylase [Pseudomonas sp. NFR16]|uniref:DNA-3-methyladenine glycosylase family protein n=1 Tax=Pseudomonas sp. NFR16 TaxID=1566248 RepID=UPI0008ADAA30|nr:DNA-3-methyladenine glycosylase [Pseudomonas sp. NFR16]SEI63839.1 DNA-3-methyladenine glycosylase II [Pseudomonas sp. NFR16]
MLQTDHLQATRQLPFKRPFDWQRMLDFFAARVTAGVEAVIDGVYLRNIEFNGSAGTLSVALAPHTDHLIVTVHGEVSRHIDELVVPVSHMFDLYADPHVIDPSLASDPWLASLVQARPGLRVPGAFSGFELVVRTIVGQQVSVKGATTIVGRLVQRAGVQIGESASEPLAWRFPTPDALARANLDKIGMPGKRVDTLQRLAASVASGELVLDARAGHVDERRRQLLALSGIGPWTVEYVAMRAWRDPDAWPASDLVLMNLMTLQDPSLTRLALHKVRAEAWKPWRAYAAMHIWNSAADVAGKAKGG